MSLAFPVLVLILSVFVFLLLLLWGTFTIFMTFLGKEELRQGNYHHKSYTETFTFLSNTVAVLLEQKGTRKFNGKIVVPK